MLIYRMLYISLIVITDQKSITDSQRKERKNSNITLKTLKIIIKSQGTRAKEE